MVDAQDKEKIGDTDMYYTAVCVCVCVYPNLEIQINTQIHIYTQKHACTHIKRKNWPKKMHTYFIVVLSWTVDFS